MASPVARSPRPRTLRDDRLTFAVENGSRSLVIGAARLAGSALRGLQSGLHTLRDRDGQTEVLQEARHPRPRGRCGSA
jgi:hypothetical protein